MSVPERYTAAGNYEYAVAAAVSAANAAYVASGLNNTLTQEEQYHLYQQQQQQQQEELFYNNGFYQAEQQLLRQQELMQQRASTTYATMPMEEDASHENVAVQQQQQQHCENSTNGGTNVSDAEWRMSEEGRYGTPGAAGLEYQKYSEQQQQQQQQLPSSTPAGNAPIEQQQQQLPQSSDNGNKNINKENINDANNSSNANAINIRNLEEELDGMTSEELFSTLKEYDALQEKYHTVLLLPKDSRREVTAGGRDGSAYVLRCLKMWYELPSDVLFSAMSLVDRFLDRMTVKPKHMACLSVASFHLAIKQLGLKPIPAEDLINISQCGCTAGDLERMANVIANKLGVQLGQGPITSVSFLRIYYQLFRNCAKEIGGPFYEFYQRFIKLEELENRLENLLCDVKTTVITPSVLALVLISLHLDFHIKASYTRGTPELKIVFNYILDLQLFMRISDRVFSCGFSIVSGILSHYNGQNKQPYKQRLVWKLSTRTLRVLRPTKSFSSDLPTIEEGITNAMDDGRRSRTESISSEEEEDWPTSPIIPIFEQC